MTTRIASLPADDLDNSKLNIRMDPQWRFYKKKWFYGPDEEDTAALMKPDMVGEGFDCDHPIVRMCAGMPLALLCMFSAMAMIREQQGVHVKACDVQDMIEKQVKQSGIQNTPGFEPLVESMQLGYDDLPHHMLKTCLLHCSMYPENYPLHMNDLVMRWVAEGFTYKVDVAKDYLEELGNRGFMVHWEDSSSTISYYRMNPIMRNFLRWKSREDNFITCSSDIKSSYAFPIHRLCIDDGADAVEGVDPLFGLDWSQIRSLVVFEGAKRNVPFEKLERVRVLDLQYHQQYLRMEPLFGHSQNIKALGNHHVKDICGGLVRVRHLFGLEGTGISEIPPEIARLQHLETLQVRFTLITELPSEIGDLQQLKTLSVKNNENLAKLPREIWNLQNLENLNLHRTKLKELPCEIGSLQNLENLNLYATIMEELPRQIGKLQHLKALEVGLASITRLPSEIGDLQNLESLDLRFNRRLTQLPREMGKLQNLKRLMLGNTGVRNIPREIGGLKKLETLQVDPTMGALPWEASQLSKLEGVPECVHQAWKKGDLVSCVLAGEMLSIRLVNVYTGSGGLIVGRKHMHIPGWIKDHFNELGSLDIRVCKLGEQDLKILLEMPKLYDLTLRLEVVPRDPIAISGEGFLGLNYLTVDCRIPPVITFQEGAMPKLFNLCFEFQFYGGPPPAANKGDPRLGLGIKHLRCLYLVHFRCNEKWYGGAAKSMSAMITVVRKEAQEHPNQIHFQVTGRKLEFFPAKVVSTSSSSSSSRGGGGGDPGSS